MIRILADGESRHRLETDAGRHVGWIRRRAIGLRGFATEGAALRAAPRAWRSLELVLKREYPGWPRFDPAFDRLRLVHDGAYEWISDGLTPIARLHRPREGADASFGIEFVLPSFSTEGVAIAAALLMARTVQDDEPGPDAPTVALSVGLEPRVRSA